MKTKIILYIVCLIILLTPALASITVSDVRVYIDENRQSNIDETGGDITIDSGTAKILDITVEITNTENTTSQAKLKATINNIDNGNDLVKDQTWFDIAADSTKSKMLSFSLPDTIRTDTYDLDLLVSMKYNNGTQFDKTITYIIDVRKGTGDTSINLEASFNNLTSVCKDITLNLGTTLRYMDQYTNCSTDLTATKELKGTFESNYNNCNTDLAACKSEKAESERLKQVAENERDARIKEVDCVARETKAKTDAQNSYMKFGGVIALIAAGLWWWNDKKKKTGTVDGTFYYEKK